MGGGGIFGKLRCVLLLLFLKIRGLTHPQYIKFLVVFVLYVNKRNGRDVLMWWPPPLLSVFKNALPPSTQLTKLKGLPQIMRTESVLFQLLFPMVLSMFAKCQCQCLQTYCIMPLKKKKKSGQLSLYGIWSVLDADHTLVVSGTRQILQVWDLVCASLNTSGKMQFKRFRQNAI